MAKKMKKRKKPETDMDRLRRAIRDLGDWHCTGNVATNPGGRFKRPIDFMVAVHRVTRFAEQTLKHRDNLRAYLRPAPLPSKAKRSDRKV